jgi:LPS O-antigen subunit length determinant protein (WzzB/FepE family)
MENENAIELFGDDDEIDLRELIFVVLKNWIIIATTTVSVAVGVAIYAHIMPDQYITKTVAVAAGPSSGAGQMAGLAALAGINFSSSGKGDVNLMNYVDLLIQNTPFCEKIIEQKWIVQRLQTKQEIKARTQPVFDTITLAQFWEFNKPDTASLNWEYRYKMAQINNLRSGKKNFISIEKDKIKGTLEIKTRFENPSLSYAVHEYLIEYLREYVENDYLNRGKDKRIFVEERVVEAKSSLNRAEYHLVNFKEKNLAAQSPAIILEGERLQREVLLQANVYTELVKQLELAKIEEKKEAIAFEVIKEADFPLGPSEPNRKLLMLIGLFGGVFAGIFVVFAKEWIKSLCPT